MKLIGLAGPKGSGKDTAATVIQSLRQGYHSYALADPLKRAVQTIFDWPSHMLDDPSYKETLDEFYGVSPRYAMQTLGTEWRDMVQPDLWLLRADKYLQKKEEEGLATGVIITDIRRDFEAEWLRDRGGIIFCLDRPGADYSGEHITEQGISEPLKDAYIYNHQDVPYMERQLESLLESHVEGTANV